MYNFSIEVGKNNADSLGIKNLEVLDGHFGTPLSKMTPAEVEDTRVALIKSLNKIVVYTAYESVKDYETYVQFFRNAHLIGVENVKLATKAIDGATNDEIQEIIKIGAAFSIKVLFELESESFEKYNFDWYKEIKGENTGLIFNANEFAKMGKGAFLGILYKSKYKDDIVVVRVCDMIFEGQKPAPIEKGNAEIKEVASCLLARSYKGYFSFTKYGENISVPDAVDAFTNALCNM
ncbi:MAG: hypothetical protein IJ027_03690 [Oscillospiraceae bacterium]|nr:hypothetical protein [Oscillospiraceae bacterium]